MYDHPLLTLIVVLATKTAPLPAKETRAAATPSSPMEIIVADPVHFKLPKGKQITDVGLICVLPDGKYRVEFKPLDPFFAGNTCYRTQRVPRELVR